MDVNTKRRDERDYVYRLGDYRNMNLRKTRMGRELNGRRLKDKMQGKNKSQIKNMDDVYNGNKG